MKNRRSFTHSFLITALCAASLLLGGLPKCHAKIIPISILNATGGVVAECQVGDILQIQGIDTTSDLYSGSDYASPHLEDKLALNTMDDQGWPTTIGGWAVQKIEKDSFSTKDQLTFAPTHTVLSFNQWMIQYNSPNMQRPIDGANRYNKWVTIILTATQPSPTAFSLIKDKDTLDEVKYTFKFNVKPASSSPLPWLSHQGPSNPSLGQTPSSSGTSTAQSDSTSTTAGGNNADANSNTGSRQSN